MGWIPERLGQPLGVIGGITENHPYLANRLYYKDDQYVKRNPKR